MSVVRTVLVLAIMAASAFAQSKVASINTQKALIDTAEIKKAQAGLEAKYKSRQDALAKIQKEIADLGGQLRAMQGKLTPQAEADMVAQGQRKERDAQRMQQDLQDDVNRDREDILQQAGARMQAVVTKLAESKGLEMIIDQSNTVYFKPTTDVTAEATKAYDAAHPVK